MKHKGIEATFRIPIQEYERYGQRYDIDMFVRAVKEMVGVPVTNGDGSKCYGIITSADTEMGNDYINLEALLFSGETTDLTELVDNIRETRTITSFALAEEWGNEQRDNPK